MKNVACTRYFASSARIRGIAMAPNSPREIGVGLVIPRAMKPDIASKSKPRVTRWGMGALPRLKAHVSANLIFYGLGFFPGRFIREKSRDMENQKRADLCASALHHHQPRPRDPVVQELPVAVEERPAEGDPGRHYYHREREPEQRGGRRHALMSRRHEPDLPRLHRERLPAAQPAPQEVSREDREKEKLQQRSSVP